MKVSVIIPFFKVAPFIERCARSLLSQTLQEVELIFVDDASPDESRSILEHVITEYPQRSVRIITHPENRGLPAARNTGLAVACGDYIYHCDSDDYLEPTMLEEMYDAVERNNADIAYCDFWLDFDTSRRYMATPDYSSSDRMIKEGFLSGGMKYNVWNKLVRHALYEQAPAICFPAGHSMGEDMTMIVLSTRADSVVRVPRPLYHYMKTNGGAFTNTFSKQHLIDIRYNSDRTFRMLDTWETADKDLYLGLFKLNIKLPFLFSGEYGQYRLWHSWFPESNHLILKNKTLPFRTRMVQLFAALHLYPLVWLYSFAVNKLFYGIRFKAK